MSFVVVYPNDQGALSIFFPTQQTSVDEAISKCPSGAVVLGQSEVPFDTWDFVNAWELQGISIQVNISKARDISKMRLREERQPLLAQLDIAFQRALETGAPTTSIVAEKQRLRDITLLADACTTLSELRALKCSKSI